MDALKFARMVNFYTAHNGNKKEIFMALSSAMSSGIAGLKAHMSALNVTGNNVANVNTYGFKAGRVTFKETVYSTQQAGSDGSELTGGTNPMQTGYGVNIGTIDLNMATQSLESTGFATDVAIQGDGFFLIGDKLGVETDSLASLDFSRVGNFRFDANGYFVDGSGGIVYGFVTTNAADVDGDGEVDDKTADAGGNGFVTSTQLVPIRVPLEVTQAFLDANPGVSRSLITQAFMDANTTPEQLNPALTGINIGDIIDMADPAYAGLNGASLTTQNLVTQAFIDDNPANATIAALTVGDVIDITDAAYAGADFTNVGTQTLVTQAFLDDNTTPETLNPALAALAVGDQVDPADPAIAALNGLDLLAVEGLAVGDAIYPGIDAATGTNTYGALVGIEDLGPIEMESISVDQGGVIKGINKQTGEPVVVGIIALANVTNPAGLTHTDGPYYQALGSTGPISVTTPGGSLSGYLNNDVGATPDTLLGQTTVTLMPNFLEQSGTDLATEFANMILYQRGYQANTRIVTVVDTMLEELINMKR